MRAWHAAHPGYAKAAREKTKAAHPERQPVYSRSYLTKLKRQTMDAYGGKCACCSETEISFLTLDHVNDDGAEHRRQLGKALQAAGAVTYRWARDNGYPDTLQVLCFNCQWGKRLNGGICPHRA